MRMRRGSSQKPLLIALGVAVVLAAGYWIFVGGGGGPKQTGIEGGPKQEQKYNMLCSACNHAYVITRTEMKAAKRGENGLLECPKCKKPEVTVSRGAEVPSEAPKP